MFLGRKSNDWSWLIIIYNTVFQPLPEGYQIDTPIGSKRQDTLEINNNDENKEDDSLIDDKSTEIPAFASKEVLFSPLYISTGIFTTRTS